GPLGASSPAVGAPPVPRGVHHHDPAIPRTRSVRRAAQATTDVTGADGGNVSRSSRYRSILMGLTSREYVEQCDRYVEAAEPPDGTSPVIDAVLESAWMLGEQALREGRMGFRLQEAIDQYRRHRQRASPDRPEGT